MRAEYEYNSVLRILFECYLNMNFCAILNLWSVFFRFLRLFITINSWEWIQQQI